MLAEQFLEELNNRGLLSEKIVADLRKQVDEMDSKVSPEAIAKLLVDNGHLTRFQARNLVTEITAPLEDKKEAIAQKKKTKKKKTKPKQPAGDDLGFAEADEVEDEEVTEIAGLTPIEDSDEIPGGLEPVDAGGLTAVDPSPAGLDDAAQPFDEMSADAWMDPSLSVTAAKPAGGSKIKNKWESKLILLGVGGLALLVVAAITLFFSLTRGSAAEYFDAAMADYKNGAYPSAIKKFDLYLEKFPKDPNVSRAEVTRGLAALRSSQTAANPFRSLTVANTVLAEIKDQEAFGEVARPELATLLPDIAEGFASRAKKETDHEKQKELVGMIDAAMELVNNPEYIPSSHRKDQLARIQKINEDKALAKRDIDRESMRTEFLGKIRQQIESGETLLAHATRRQLVDAYPGLETHPEVLAVMAEIAGRERDLVEVTGQSLEVSNTEPPAARGHRRAVLIDRSAGQLVSGASGRKAFFLIAGSVYALNAEDGKVRWRRSVGYETSSPPGSIEVGTGSHAIVTDARSNQILRLKGGDGSLVWSAQLGEPFADPIVQNGRIFVATLSGKVWQLDGETGEADRFAQLPMSLSVGPGVNSTQPQIYQAGDHSNVYVLSADTMQCQEVLHTGHKPGTVTVPPLMAASHLFVAENAGTDYANIHIYRSNPSGLELKRAQKSFRVKGNIVVPPIVSRRRVLFITDRRGVHIYNVDPNADPAVTVLAEQVAPENQALTGYATVSGVQMFIADSRIAKYEVQLTTSKLKRPWIEKTGDTFLAAPQVHGNAVLHARRPNNAAGVTITATDTATGADIWSTRLGYPVAQATVDTKRQRLVAISSSGSFFEMTPRQLSSGYIDGSTESATGSSRAFDHPLDLGDGRYAIFSTTKQDQLMIYDPTRDSDRLRLTNLGITDGDVSALPIALDGGVLLPLKTGEVFLVDPITGSNKVEPFHPPLAPGSKTFWTRPVPLEGGNEFIIANDQPVLYRLEIRSRGKPHLAKTAEQDLELPLGETMAVLGETLFATSQTAGGDVLLTFNAKNLRAKKELATSGTILQGPYASGNRVFFVTDSEGIHCLGGDGEVRWTKPNPYGPLASEPLVDGSDFVFVSVAGTVWKMSGSTGEEIGKQEVGEPLAGNPIVFSGRMLLPGSDGTLHMVDLP